MSDTGELSTFGIYGKSGDGIVAAIGSINKFSALCNFDVSTGVFAAIKTAGQGAGAVGGFQKSCSPVQSVGGDTVPFFIIAVDDGKSGVEGEVTRFQSDRWA